MSLSRWAYAVRLLLDLNDGAVLVSPLDDISLLAGALNNLGLFEARKPLREAVELNEVPDAGERGIDDGTLID